jgi:hypothetical protein
MTRGRRLGRSTTERRLAESAEVKAELAATRARAARSRAAADEIRQSIESLRSEAQRGADRVQ